MKKIILILVLFLSVPDLNIHAEKAPLYNSITCNEIGDGWYKATVDYHNYGTGYMNTYTLKVKVEDDEVTSISFGNGGYIHSGYNDYGYIYSGGDLSFTHDYDGRLTEANTTVTIYEEDGNIRTYDITIE